MTPTQKISTAGLLIHKNKALIVKRSKDDDFLAGYFELPGGSVDFGEEVETGLIREFKEEVGLDVFPVALIRIMSWIQKEKNQHTHELVYLVECKDPSKLVLSNEHDEFKWISFTDINTIEPMTGEIKSNLVLGFQLYEQENVPLGTYRHYKGKEYEVLHNAFDEKTMAKVVVYRAKYPSELGENAVFVRSTHNFLEEVTHNNQKTPRFKRIH